MSNLIPRPSDVPERPSGANGLEGLMSDDEIEKAADEAGLIFLKGKTIRALKKLGEHIDATGLIHVKMPGLVETEERLRELDTKCDEVFDKFEDPETKINALRLAKEICGELNRSAEIALKLAEAGLVNKPKKGAAQSRLPTGPVNVLIKAEGNVSVTEAPPQQADST